MSGFSYGGMQTINVFLCHHLKDFGWFGGYSPAGGNYGSDMIASCLKQEDPCDVPVNYFYIQWGSNELATSSAAASANGLATKAAPTITIGEFQLPGDGRWPRLRQLHHRAVQLRPNRIPVLRPRSPNAPGDNAACDDAEGDHNRDGGYRGVARARLWRIADTLSRLGRTLSVSTL